MLDKFVEQIKLIIQRSSESVCNFGQLSTQRLQSLKQCVVSKTGFTWQQLLSRMQTIIAVLKLQWAMLVGRVRRNVQAVISRADAYALDLSNRLNHRYAVCKKTWHANSHFTFWLIPADGSHIAKTHVKKTHLKYAVSGLAAFLVVVSVTIGVLAHFAIQSQTQKQELAEYPTPYRFQIYVRQATKSSWAAPFHQPYVQLKYLN